VRAFYRDFGLAETAPGRFADADGGEQLPIAPAPRARCASSRSASTTPTISRAPSRRSRGSASRWSTARARSSSRAATGVRVRLEIQPRLDQKPPARVAVNAPGRTDRVNARSRGALSEPPTPPRKLSHVVVGSPDAAASRRFFVEGIGFKVSDEMPGGLASFLRCSTDHHNLLVQAGPVSYLHHTAWEMDDVDAIGRAAAAMVAADPERHVWGFGRHGIGSNYFWYLRDPGGAFAEYTSDLDSITEDEAWKVAASVPVHPLAVWGPPGSEELHRARRHRGARARGGVSDRIDVAIVGCGPVGLALAILLGQRGHRVHIVERWPEPYPLPRAVHFDHEVGRILQSAGIAPALDGRTVAAPTYEWRNTPRARR
jgi:catechol 2,3-dioxygenase-like lactoylglutathione lyase family enzyme